MSKFKKRRLTSAWSRRGAEVDDCDLDDYSAGRGSPSPTDMAARYGYDQMGNRIKARPAGENADAAPRHRKDSVVAMLEKLRDSDDFEAAGSGHAARRRAQEAARTLNFIAMRKAKHRPDVKHAKATLSTKAGHSDHDGDGSRALGGVGSLQPKVQVMGGV